MLRGRQRDVVTPEELSEEAGNYPRTGVLVELVAAEAVDLVAGKLQLPIFRHHLGIQLGVRLAVGRVVLLAAVDLQDQADLEPFPTSR